MLKQSRKILYININWDISGNSIFKHIELKEQ